MMWNGDGWGHMGGWGWIGMLFMLLFWFGVLAVIFWAVIGFRPGATTTTAEGPRSDRAQTILRERYASGDITDEEFAQASKTLDETRL